jgi:hypothetical protein
MRTRAVSLPVPRSPDTPHGMTIDSREALLAIDRRHLWRPYTSSEDHETKTPLFIERAEGPYLYAADGHALPGRQRRVVVQQPGPRAPALARGADAAGARSLALLDGGHRAPFGGAAGAGARGHRAARADARVLQRQRQHLGGGGAQDGVPVLAAERPAGAHALPGAAGRLSRRHHRGHGGGQRGRVQRAVRAALSGWARRGGGAARARARRRRSRLGRALQRARAHAARRRRRDRGGHRGAVDPGRRGHAHLPRAAPATAARGDARGGHVPDLRRGLHRPRTHRRPCGPARARASRRTCCAPPRGCRVERCRSRPRWPPSACSTASAATRRAR